MSNQDFPSGSPGSPPAHETKAAKDALSRASAFAKDAGEKVKQAASDTAATLTGEVKEILNRQVGGGADILGNMARRDSPQIADLARTLATRVDGYAHDLRDQSVEQIWQTATDFTRRQPAVVFGLAALAGFFALRIVKSSPSMPAPSIQPSHSYRAGEGGSSSYGA